MLAAAAEFLPTLRESRRQLIVGAVWLLAVVALAAGVPQPPPGSVLADLTDLIGPTGTVIAVGLVAYAAGSVTDDFWIAVMSWQSFDEEGSNRRTLATLEEHNDEGNRLLQPARLERWYLARRHPKALASLLAEDEEETEQEDDGRDAGASRDIDLRPMARETFEAIGMDQGRLLGALDRRVGQTHSELLLRLGLLWPVTICGVGLSLNNSIAWIFPTALILCVLLWQIDIRMERRAKRLQDAVFATKAIFLVAQNLSMNAEIKELETELARKKAALGEGGLGKVDEGGRASST